MAAILGRSCLTLFGCILVGAWLPSATAENLWFEIQAKTDHPPGHGDIVLPENGRLNVELTVSLNAGNFTCAQGAQVQIKAAADRTGYPRWAGAAINPDPAEALFDVPTGEPGATTPKPYANKAKKIFFEIAWNEDERPPREARFDYVIELYHARLTKGEGTCVTHPMGSIHYGSLTLPVSMPDRNETVAPDCPPELPDCELQEDEPIETGGSTPSPAAALTLLTAMGVAFVRRRRRR